MSKIATETFFEQLLTTYLNTVRGICQITRLVSYEIISVICSNTITSLVMDKLRDRLH